LEQIDFLENEKREEARQQMTVAAFIGWQSGAGGDKDFNDYLRSLNLTDKPPTMSDEERKKVAEKNIDLATRILNMTNKGAIK